MAETEINLPSNKDRTQNVKCCLECGEPIYNNQDICAKCKKKLRKYPDDCYDPKDKSNYR